MKIAIYTRVSTHYQVDKDSLPLQREELINYSKFILNTNDYVVFEDAGYSGKNTDRPAFQEMIKRVKKGEFTHILVWKIDRISRNLLDFCDMYEDLKKYNCIFVSKNEQFDTSSAMGEAMLKIILVFAELERKLTAERVTAVMLDRASKGLWNGTPMPLGYKWDEELKGPVIDEEEKTTVELIYDMYLKEESTTVIRNYLNANNIKTKRGGSWTTKAVSDIIRNPFYIGTYRYNYRDSNRRKKKEDEWVIVENNHDLLISVEIYNKCNDIMDRNALRSNSKFRANGKTHIFGGLIKCGSCGGNYYAKQDKPNKDGYIPSLYVCNNRYNRNNCEQKTINEKYIYSFILEIITNINNMDQDLTYEEFKKSLSKNLDVTDVNCESLYKHLSIKKYDFYTINKTNNKSKNYKNDIKAKELEKYKRALNRLEEIYLFDDDGISSKDYLLKKKNLEDKIKEINNSMKENTSIEDEAIDYKLLNSVMNNIFLKKLDNKTAINLIGRKDIKEVFNYILKNIVILDRKIISITFKNGLNIGFSY
ncbi:MAG: recombinase family protein [Bacilli bacterium]